MSIPRVLIYIVICFWYDNYILIMIFLFLWHPLFVTWTGKEAQSKSKDKAKEETILPKCNVIVHHPSSKNLWNTEDNNQTKKDSSNSSHSSTKANNSLRGDQEESGMQPFNTIRRKIIGKKKA